MSYDGEQTPISSRPGAGREPRLLEQVRGRMRLKHYSLRTEQAYLYWIRRYIRAWLPRHPRELDGAAVEAFLPRDRGWRAPAAGLPCISSEAFCPDAGARWHRRRGFLPRGRGWGAPAAMLRALTARLFAPAAGLAGIDAVAFCLARKAPGVARKGRDVARKAPSLANGLPAPASGPATPAQRFPAQRPSPALRARRPAQDTHPALSCGPGNPACPGPRRCGAGSRRRW